MNIKNYRNSISGSSINSDHRNKNTMERSIPNYININKNGAGVNVTKTINLEQKPSSHRRHHRSHHHLRQGHDKNVQSIQPKICHSLASSNSYLSSAFAHNFASQKRSTELSMENKLVLSPIVFQGICLITRI